MVDLSGAFVDVPESQPWIPALDGVFPPSAKKANCKVYFSPLAATLVASTLAAAFAALIFAKEYEIPEKIGLAVLAFAAFCLGTSAVYLLNDILDRENDKKHPLKSLRPIASGKVPIGMAVALSAFLLLGGLLISFLVNFETFIILAAYVVINLAYSLFLKHIVIIDVMTIAAGFVLRAVAGGLAISVPISPWLMVCTTLLALFLGFGKRRHELSILSNDAGSHRKALDNYSIPFLDQMISIVTASTVVCYSFYTISPEVEEKLGTRINQHRVGEAAETLGAPGGVVATGCPFCLTMLKDGVNETSREEQLKVLDIAEIVAQAVPPEAPKA